MVLQSSNGKGSSRKAVSAPLLMKYCFLDNNPADIINIFLDSIPNKSSTTSLDEAQFLICSPSSERIDTLYETKFKRTRSTNQAIIVVREMPIPNEFNNYQETDLGPISTNTGRELYDIKIKNGSLWMNDSLQTLNIKLNIGTDNRPSSNSRTDHSVNYENYISDQDQTNTSHRSKKCTLS